MQKKQAKNLYRYLQNAVFAYLILVSSFPLSLNAENKISDPAKDFFDLSLEELMNVKVDKNVKKKV